MNKYDRAKRNDFIKRSYRDQADKDYIAARAVHRMGLLDQFLWLALMAMEKYLKAILLFNDLPTHGIKHDIEKALNLVSQIGALNCEFTKEERAFVKHLADQGQDRYFERFRFADGEELLNLDIAVWAVRRYCDDYFFPFDPGEQIHARYQLAFLQSLNKPSLKKAPHKFRLASKGFLEEVLDTHKHVPLRSVLIWKNLFFGRTRKRRVRVWITGLQSNPSTFMYPELYPWLIEHVPLDAKTRALLDKRRTKQQPTG